MRRYSNMLSSMDKGIGRIMETLRKHGIEENTLVIFTSDNGGEPTGVKHGKVNGELRDIRQQCMKGVLRSLLSSIGRIK